MIQAPHVGHRQAAASWGNELTQGLVSCGLVVETVSRCCFRHHSGSVAGAVHGDLIFVAGPRGSLELGDVHLLDALTRESPGNWRCTPAGCADEGITGVVALEF